MLGSARAEDGSGDNAQAPVAWMHCERGCCVDESAEYFRAHRCVVLEGGGGLAISIGKLVMESVG